ncbi:cysteine dioxygenase family protein [Kineococcus glutinatus]|uniref:Cysteine dioxygenase type I n=1 Tax=Kineococcus glutinatus TaxID=1070872 RepID=A0ABP9HKX3_9ACTN
MTTQPLSPPVPAAALPASEATRTLAALVRGIAARPQLWRPAVRFGAAERWWTRLDAPAGVDVWLLTWLRSQGTDLHDHGGSAAAFTVVAGTLTESRATRDGALHAVPLTPAGGARTVEPDVVHDVRNDHDEPAVSIHAYAPRLQRMSFYAVTGTGLTRVRTVRTDEPEVDA